MVDHTPSRGPPPRKVRERVRSVKGGQPDPRARRVCPEVFVPLLRSVASVPPRRLDIVDAFYAGSGVSVMAAGHGSDGRGRPGESAAQAGLRMVRFLRAHHFKGAWGESLVSATLLDRLPDGWVLFDDWTTPGANDNTDHLLVGPGGVFLIDAKAWSGEVTVTDGRLVVVRGERSYPSNKLGALVGRSKRWRGHIDCRWVETVACFVGTTLLAPSSTEPTDRFEHRHVHCVTLDGHAEFVLSRGPRLNAAEVERIEQRVMELGPYGSTDDASDEVEASGRTVSARSRWRVVAWTEHFNADLKSAIQGALDSAGRRQVKGRTAATVFTAITIVAENVRRIEVHLALSAVPKPPKPRSKRRRDQPGSWGEESPLRRKQPGPAPPAAA